MKLTKFVGKLILTRLIFIRYYRVSMELICLFAREFELDWLYSKCFLQWFKWGFAEWILRCPIYESN